MEKASYKKLAMTLFISFCVMYSVMFLNVAEADHIYLSLTRFYMSLLMVAPMALIMVVMMSSMYPDNKTNAAIILAGILTFFGSLALLRKQVPISDVQYMKAMIPHHSSAIMTSQHANIKDPEVRRLADGIIASQEREITEMKHLLDKLEK